VQRMIFVCGLHRSGTTMLEQYLFSRFEVSGLRANVPENEGQFLQNVYKPAFYYGGPGKFAFSRKMQEDLILLDNYTDYRSKITSSWAKYCVGQGDFLIEKSPPNLTKIWWLRQVFPDSLFIIWTRDPRVVSGATQKWSRTSLEELMMHWSTAYQIAKNDLKGVNYFLMSYERFCQSPDQCLEESGILKYLTERRLPLKLDPRFEEVKNSNSKYINAFKEKIMSGGSWEYFGYLQ
jgi:hypothetical protein